MSVERYALPTFSTPDGDLRVLEFRRLPFAPLRDFWITRVAPGVIRGGHAHRECHQFFRAFAGCAELRVWVPGAPAVPTFRYNLHLGSDAVHVPPWHWVEVTCASDSALIHVLCSHPYAQADYLCDRGVFEAGP